jgi:hypothetical protein
MRKEYATMCDKMPRECPKEFLPLVEEIKRRRGEMMRSEVARLVEEFQRDRPIQTTESK